MRTQWHCQTHDETQVGAARRFAATLAAELRFSETLAGKVAIIVTELGRNAVRHAGGGTLMIQPIERPTRKGIEIISVDRGPGMRDLEQCLRDGYSTAGTPGTGLGAVRRLATEFDVHSVESRGAVVLARVMTAPQPQEEWVNWGAVFTPAPGEKIPGDAWEIAEGNGNIVVTLADGLGHGISAASAAAAAMSAFRSDPFRTVPDLLGAMHTAMRGTRGAAAAVAHCTRSGSVSFGGVGNIGASLVRPGYRTRGLASFNGTLGIDARTIRELPYTWERNDVLVMHSDGIQGRWAPDDLSGLMTRHPGVIAAVLHRDYTRGHDDAAVVAVRWV
jgi:anti-sigma regulatory factor (Ser/Thr protein kinase)